MELTKKEAEDLNKALTRICGQEYCHLYNDRTINLDGVYSVDMLKAIIRVMEKEPADPEEFLYIDEEGNTLQVIAGEPGDDVKDGVKGGVCTVVRKRGSVYEYMSELGTWMRV